MDWTMDWNMDSIKIESIFQSIVQSMVQIESIFQSIVQSMVQSRVQSPAFALTQNQCVKWQVHVTSHIPFLFTDSLSHPAHATRGAGPSSIEQQHVMVAKDTACRQGRVDLPRQGEDIQVKCKLILTRGTLGAKSSLIIPSVARLCLGSIELSWAIGDDDGRPPCQIVSTML